MVSGALMLALIACKDTTATSAKAPSLSKADPSASAKSADKTANPIPAKELCAEGVCMKAPKTLGALFEATEVALTWSNGEIVYAFTAKGQFWRYQAPEGWAFDGTPPKPVVAFGPASKDPNSATALMDDGRPLLRRGPKVWHTTSVASNMKDFGTLQEGWIVDNNCAWVTLKDANGQTVLGRWKHRDWRQVPTPQGAEKATIGHVAPYHGHAWVTYSEDNRTRFFHRKLRPKPEWKEDAPALEGRHLISVGDDGQLFALGGSTIQKLVNNEWLPSHTMPEAGEFRWVRRFGAHQVALFEGKDSTKGTLLRFDGEGWRSTAGEIIGSKPQTTVWLASNTTFAPAPKAPQDTRLGLISKPVA